MIISEVYEKYEIPPLLRQHQLRAASVGNYIASHWKNKELLNKDAITQTLLLHDMGNIIKFDFNDSTLNLPEEKEYLQKVQRKFVEKYGNNEHEGTYAIAREIGVSEKIYHLLTHMGTKMLNNVVESGVWEEKIVTYADLRSGPFSVVTVNERFDDIIKRYRNRTHELSNIERTEKLRESCLLVEKQLQEYTTIPLSEVNEDKIKESIEQLKAYKINQ